MRAQKIKVAARLRPRLGAEIDDGSVRVEHVHDISTGSTVTGTSCISVANPRDPAQIFKFPFTSCYDKDSTQDSIFAHDVAPLLDHCFNGITVTIFAYGVTSSGKTHTMQGTKTDPGVIPRTVRSLFDSKRLAQDRDVSISISYMEIYKDEVYDLLVPRENAQKLPVRENDAGQVFVANLSTLPVASVSEFDVLYAQATKNRSVSSTLLNHASSRSHAVLIMTMSIYDPSASTVLTGKVNLVDLAGSENNKLTGNDSLRMAESAAINKSLSVLGQVVHALNQGATRIPYRNSKLTRLLQDALGGPSVGLLICNLAPGVRFRQDTFNTLNFAVRTKNVENKPIVNERNAPQIAHPPFPASHLSASSANGSAHRPSLGVRAKIGHSPLVGRSRRSSFTRRPSSILPRPRALKLAPPTSGASVATTLQSVEEPEDGKHSRGWNGLSEREIDHRIQEQISKAVEIEVARRLKEAEEKRKKEQQTLSPERRDTPASSRRGAEQSSILSPLLKRHRDLNKELKARLSELEKKMERGTKETQLAEVLSPVSRKRTGRAYVALARAHSEKGNLEIALDLYRKASSYVPDNHKLRERIIEIEWAVENDRPFLPSPKKEYMVKGKVRSKRRNRGNATAKKGGSADDGSLASMLPPAGEDVDSGAYN